MQPDLIIGVDAGTSFIKAVAFDLDGVQLGTGSVRTRVDHRADGGAEQDMQWTWEAMARALHALAGKVERLAERSAALAITGQGDGTWLVDAHGEPVAPAWLWLDGRSGALTRELRASGVGERVSRITGTGLNASLQSMQLKRLQTLNPQALQRARHALHCKDWLYFKASGVIATDAAEAVFTFGDYRSGRYDERVIELLGLAGCRHLLPPILGDSEQDGRLGDAAAQATGLLPGTPVVLGPMDVPATTLGAGGYCADRQVGCSILGSTGMHARVCASADEVRPLAQAGYVMRMPVPGSCGAFMSHMAASLNVDWLLRVVTEAAALTGASPDPAHLLAALEPAVHQARPGSVLFHPFICANGERGPFVDPNARAQFVGLTSGSGIADLARAVYEGIAFAARDCYEAIGLPDEVRLGGGVARSPAMRQILASVLNRPLRVSSRDEAGAAGAAICAAVVLGHCASHEAAQALWVAPYLAADVTRPDAGLAARYDELFDIYRRSYGALGPTWDALAANRAGHAEPCPN